MRIITGDIANLIIIILSLNFLFFLSIYSVDFYRFINIDIPGLILLSLIFILVYKELLPSLFFIFLDNLSISLESKLYYVKYISKLIYIRDFIFNIIL